jgi:anti-sigma regulatory factor (Ser/Thr protein kinase)
VKQDDVRLDILSDPKLLTAVRGLVRAYLTGAGFPADRADEVVLAVDEACANAMRHSYAGRPEGRVSLTARSGDGWIEFVLTDQGAPADMGRCVKREWSAPDATRLTPGGLGVQLIYEVFDDVQYEPGPDRGNRVIMRLSEPRKTDSA